MRCENLFCVYWSEYECILNDIELDIQGNCQNCIYVDINKTLLKKAREQFINNG